MDYISRLSTCRGVKILRIQCSLKAGSIARVLGFTCIIPALRRILPTFRSYLGPSRQTQFAFSPATEVASDRQQDAVALRRSGEIHQP